MKSVIEAAEKKFGKVIACKAKRRESCGEYMLAIKRDSHPFPDRPYMSITGSMNARALVPGDPLVGFFWGHYDLTEEMALKDVEAA